MGASRMIASDYYWDGDDLIVVTDDGTYRLKNAYMSKLEFPGLDCAATELATIENTVRYDG